MKILVIGGTGNISRWFVKELAKSGHACTVYNRGRNSGAIPANVKSITGDRRDHSAFERDMQKAGLFDCVIDMVGYEVGDARSAISAFEGRTGQYIFCSTVDVYPKPQLIYPVLPDAHLGPSIDFPYALKKWQMEVLLCEAAKKGDFPLTIIRPGATYSEGWSPLITSFGGSLTHLQRMREGKRMILHGDGSVLWSMTHSADVAKAFIGAAGNQSTIGKAYNLSGDEWMTWETMHRVVADELNAPAPLFEYIPTRLLADLAPQETEWCVQNFQFNNLFDASEAKKGLGFRYTVSYREGVRRCLAFLDTHGGIDSAGESGYYETILKKWDTVRSAILK